MALTKREQQKLDRLLKLRTDAEIALFDEVQEAMDEVEEAKQRTEQAIEKTEEAKQVVEELRDYVDNHLVGPEGPKGKQGERGPKGEKGDRGEKGKDGKDGKNGKDGRDGIDGLDGERGEDGSPDTGEEIVNKINSLGTWNNRYKIDASHIKNLPKGGGGLFSKHTLDSVKDSGTIVKYGVTSLNFGDNLTVIADDEAGSVTIDAVGGAGGGTPGGADTQVQFNDGGSFGGDTGLTYNKTTDTLTVGTGAGIVVSHSIKSDASDGLLVEANNGTDVGLLGTGNTANVSWYGSHNFSTATQDTLAAFTGAGKTLGSLATATYPSLTEVSYVKGVTSAIQTQLDSKASTAYVDSAVTGLLDFKGNTDASTNPNYPAASKGDAYVVSVAGKIGGAAGTSVDVGDVYVASADNAGGTQAAVGSSWFILEHNLVGALLASNNLSDVANASTARTNLGLAIGVDVQAYSADTAFRTDKLSAFAATTSAELAGVISDETGSGSLVFATSPTLTTPTIGDARASSITVPSTGGGYVTYNTADEVTNYEKATLGWSSNVLKLLLTTGGTGTPRVFSIQSAATTDFFTLRNSAGTKLFNFENASVDATPTAKLELFRSGTSAGYILATAANALFFNSNVKMDFAYNGVTVMSFDSTKSTLFSSTLSASSGSETILRLNPTISQSGTAGYTNLYMNVTESSTGSGAKNLAAFYVGGVQKVLIDNTGAATFAGDVTVPAEVYGAGWNGSNEAPTKNDVYDKVEAVIATIPTAYTDEMAQDAVGGMIADTSTIDLTYTDGTPELKADLKTSSIDNTHLTAAIITGLTADASPDSANDYVMTYDASATALKKVLLSNLPGGGGGANTALSNLASVAINTDLVLGTSDAAALGSTTKMWSDLFLASGAVINFNNGNATITHSAGLLTSNVDISVPDEAYGVGWNGSTEVATKNAIYDKIETLSAGSGHAITEEGGAALTARATLNFIGNAVTAADDAGNSRTNVTIASASTTQEGTAEAAIASEVNTGTDAARYVTPDSLAGSNFGVKTVSIQVFPYNAIAVTGDSAACFRIPVELNGMNLVSVGAAVYTAGTTNTLDIQIRNKTQTADMLTTKLTIDSTEVDSSSAATAAVIDTANDDVATGDVICIDIDAVQTTPSQGLFINLGFQLP